MPYTQLFPINAGKWFKFNNYQLEDGYVRPSKDAELKDYDPWRPFHRARDGHRDPNPFTELSRLAVRIRFKAVAGGSYRRQWFVLYKDPCRETRRSIETYEFVGEGHGDHELTKSGEEAILDWCRQMGLLGLVLRDTRKISLAPRWDRYTHNERVAILRTFTRTSAGWRFDDVGDLPLGARGKRGDAGKLVPSRRAPPDFPDPHVEFRAVEDVDWEPASLAEYGRFFPDVPATEKETFEYDLPTSEEFWYAYGEPVELVFREALRFHKTFEILKSVAEENCDLSDLDLEADFVSDSADDPTPLRALRALNSWLESVSPVVDQVDSRFVQRWSTPSLFEAIVLMGFIELTEKGRRFLQCEGCGSLFATGSPKRHFCRDTCRHTTEMRRFRNRQKRARQLRADGLKLRDIAKDLDTDVKTIKSWLE